MAAHAYFGTSAITALTVQSTLGVAATYPVDSRILAETLSHLVADIPPTGVKIGMLANAENARVIAAFLRRVHKTHSHIPIVLDPVMRSSSGRELLEPEGVSVLREELLSLVDWITPNLAELSVLSDGNIAEAAQALIERFPGLNVVVTGGDQAANDYVALADGRTLWLGGEKIDSRSTHGTGCAFSSALLCRLCDQEDPFTAVTSAKRYVEQAILRAPKIGSGNGPMNLLWPLQTK